VLEGQVNEIRSMVNSKNDLGQLGHSISEHLGLIIQAMHDSLTGLPNCEFYQQRLEQELQRIKRYGGKLSLMVCDVDLFKRINDNYSHLAGDKVLNIIAKLLQKNLRSSDFIARYGGEEFVALMPETSTAEAKIVTEKLRRKVKRRPFNFKKEPIQITVSFGISEFAPSKSADEVFSRADKALYAAKEKGRNQVQLR
jgi:diguanylate cyclase